MTRHPRTPRSLRPLARIWSDINYAQKRLFELQTGVRVIERRR